MVVDESPGVASAPPSSPTAARSRSSKKPRNRVLGGVGTRIQKTPPAAKRRSPSPKKLLSPKDKQLAGSPLDRVGDAERELELVRYEEMIEEKSLFPQADKWAADEARLFEILFMRQYSPLMPSFWDIDFKGIPIPDILFQTSDVDRPVIYSRSGNDFHGTGRQLTCMGLKLSLTSSQPPGPW